MPVSKFKKLILESRTEMEVRRLVHWHYQHLIGTQAELFQAIAFADARAMALADPNELIAA